MRSNNAWLFALLTSGSLTGPVVAQVDKEDPEFVKQSPTIGEKFPELTIYASDGKEFNTSQFRGNHTVISFGCLTCPPFMRKVAGLEAVHRDYSSKNVRCYFVYKALAHPERNGIIQPFTLEERLLQAREATKRLGNTIPFLVDAMDNRLKHTLIDRHNVPIGEPAAYDNAEYIVDPKGTIVRKRTWSNPEQVRKDLEVLVGKTDKFTRPEDVLLNVEKRETDETRKRPSAGIPRMGMLALVTSARNKTGGLPFYAKLRAEADESAIERGTGKLYLGFHLDPFLGAHWNHMNSPLRFELEVPEGVKFSVETGEASRHKSATDTEPVEFLLDIVSWPKDKPVRLTVIYSVCTNNLCHEIYQAYELRCEHDPDGGRAVGSLSSYTPEAPAFEMERPSPTITAVLFFAMVFWPCWIPFVARAMEPEPRRGWFLFLGLAGLVIGCACYVPTVLHSSDWIEFGMDGQYELSSDAMLQVSVCMVWQGLYLALISILLLLSRHRRPRVFGILVAFAAVLGHLAFRAGEWMR